MGRGTNNSQKAALTLAGRYDLMPPTSGAMLSGKPWAAHIGDVKVARLAMINVLAKAPAGLVSDDLRSAAIENGAAPDEVATAQVQLIRQHVIVKYPADETWHLTSDSRLVEEWRELSAA